MPDGEPTTITLGEVELGYDVVGPGPDKPAMVFLHGYAFRSTTALHGSGPYDELLASLARRYAVHAIDLRGHGASSEHGAGWSKQALAQDVAGFCRALDLRRPVLVGHSFGCEVGVLAAAEHPDLFSALCLLAPGPADPRRDPVTALDFLVEHGRDRDALREAFGPMFRRAPGAMLETVLDAVTLVGVDVHRAQRRENATVSIDHRLDDISVPVLALLGGGDTVVSPARQHDMIRRLARSKEVILSGEGHMIPQESPSTVAREVLTFLDHDRGSPSISNGESDPPAPPP